MSEFEWLNADGRCGELERFRSEWKNELHTKSSLNYGNSLGGPQEDTLASSTRLYKLAASYEQRGSLNEAVRLYRQAIRSCPEVEQFLKSQQACGSSSSPQQHARIETTLKPENLQSGENEIDVELFKQQLAVEFLGKSEIRYCSPAKSVDSITGGSKTHISALPAELLLHIFQLVVSDQLDFRQFEQLSVVCRGFYVLCRNQEIWKLSCHAVWGGVESAMKQLCTYRSSFSLSWRQVFLNTPRVHFNGAYMAKISYIRKGEDNSFCERGFAHQWHLVTYYRYLRFFPNGSVVMMTSADEPCTVLPDLRVHPCPRTTALTGHYKLEGNPIESGFIVMWIKRQQNLLKNNSSACLPDRDQTFSMHFRIGSSKRRKHCCLHWLNYTLIERQKDGQESMNKLFLSDNNFSPLYFSRVRSYSVISTV